VSAGRPVTTVDPQSHGHTAETDRPLRFETLADDIAGLIGHLDLAYTDVMGYSFGAGAALRTAIQHPGLVRRLVVVSEPYRRDGWFAESLAGLDQMGPQLAEMLMQPTGTARHVRWRGWRSCPAIRTTTSSTRPT
jgi:pimeloyl-ACP methyl ester carboxylesterase